ncbi:MAG: glycosyltransferase family 4 protein [Proteobacteria bacterium]|nr:glycosyltransferase family 4 protein [Pseudomonadota bacterium]
MIHVHIVSNSFFPLQGGMEKSIERISRSLSTISDFRVHLYVRNVETLENINNQPFTLKSLHTLKRDIFEPCESYTDTYENNKWKEKEAHKLEFLILKNEIFKTLSEFPNDPHIMVSFYMSSTGFFGQHVSKSLKIPHIVTVRGWDFCRDLYNLYSIGCIDFVLKNADYIITTNKEQLESLKDLFLVDEKISTITNAVEPFFLEKPWIYQKKQTISLISDIGFYYAKGTHILLKSFEILLSKGYPLTLKILGKTETQNKSYWTNLKEKFKENYQNSFFYSDFVESSEDLRTLLLNSDIYCSPTLGEGCSNARIQALCVGIPMVTTQCSEILDFYPLLNPKFIELSLPGEIEGFTSALEKIIVKIQTHQIQRQDKDYNMILKNIFSFETEKIKWEKVIRETLKKFQSNLPKN